MGLNTQNDLNSIPGIHTVAGENGLPEIFLCLDLHTLAIHMPTYMHMCTHIHTKR